MHPRRSRPEPLAATPVNQSPKYAARKALEDAINEYAKAYAAYCMKVASAPLTDAMEQRMFKAIDAFEAACVEEETG